MVCTHEKHHLVPIDKLRSAAVFSAGGKEVGKINQLIVDKELGRISYAVIDFCGFMCSKTSKHLVPWSSLTYDKVRDQFSTKITDNELESCPEVPADLSASSDWENTIHQHFRATPYWVESVK